MTANLGRKTHPRKYLPYDGKWQSFPIAKVNFDFCLPGESEQIPQGLVVDRVMELNLRSLHNAAQVAR